jgi:hypothetical protein
MLIILVAAYRMNPAYSGHGWGRRKKKKKRLPGMKGVVVWWS